MLRTPPIRPQLSGRCKPVHTRAGSAGGNHPMQEGLARHFFTLSRARPQFGRDLRQQTQAGFFAGLRPLGGGFAPDWSWLAPLERCLCNRPAYP